MQERPAATSARGLFPEPTGPFSLTLPFAILGLLGGFLTAMVFHAGDLNPLSWLLIGITPITSAFLGAFLSPRLRAGEAGGLLGSGGTGGTGALATAVRVVAWIISAGIVNGALVGLFIAPPFGLILGVVFGVICSIPFIPALGAVALMARRIGRARPSSIVDKADRRAVFRMTSVVASLAWVFSPWGFAEYAPTGLTVPFAAVTILLILLVLDVSAFVRTGSLAASAEALGPPGAERPERAADASVVDFGLGDEEVGEVAKQGAVYRDHAQTVRVFRGSGLRARSELGWAIAADGLAIAIAAGLLLAQAAALASII